MVVDIPKAVVTFAPGTLEASNRVGARRVRNQEGSKDMSRSDWFDEGSLATVVLARDDDDDYEKDDLDEELVDDEDWSEDDDDWDDDDWADEEEDEDDDDDDWEEDDDDDLFGREPRRHRPDWQ